MGRNETKRKLSKTSPKSAEKSKKKRNIIHSEPLDNESTLMIDPKMADKSGQEYVDQLQNQLETVTSPLLDQSELRIVKAVDVLYNSKMDKMKRLLKEEISAHLEDKHKLSDTNLELKLMKIKHRDLEEKFEALKQRVVLSEMKSMRNNLIFSGVPAHLKTESDLKRWFETLLKDLGCTVMPEIGTIHRLKPNKSNKPSDVVVRFMDYKEKRELFGHRFHLRSIPAYRNIFLDEQFPQEIMEERKVLKAIAAEARLQFPEQAKSISVYENTLFINNTRYKVSTLHLLPESLQSIVHGYKQDDEGIAFFTKRCPLSNHFPCDFEYNGVMYCNGEQLIMAQKARCFDDQDSLTQILNNENPAAIKGIGGRIKGFKEREWLKEVKEAITPGLYKKFKTNLECRNMLLSTGERVIGEATSEDPWEVGMRLNNPEVLDQTKWKGKSNLIGKILMNIRGQLREEGYSVEEA